MEDNLQNTKTQTTVEMKKTDKIQNMNKKQNRDKRLKKLKRNQIQNTDNDNTEVDVSESRIGSFRINRTGIELIIGNLLYIRADINSNICRQKAECFHWVHTWSHYISINDIPYDNSH